MISIVHAVTGAYIASQMPSWPGLFLPLAFLSHFALDYVLHYDIGVAMTRGRWKKIKIAAWESLDLLGAVVLVALIWQQTPSHFDWQLWAAALAAITPDLLEATDYFFERPLKILQPFYRVHHHYHHSTPKIVAGLLPQAALVATLGLVVLLNK